MDGTKLLNKEKKKKKKQNELMKPKVYCRGKKKKRKAKWVDETKRLL